MSTIGVLAVPAAPPPDPSGHPGWDRIVSTWTDWLGQPWELTRPEGGLFLKREEVRGLGMPPVKHYRDERNTIPGSQWRGLTYGARDVFWPLYMFHDGSSRDYVARDEAFWRGMHPRHTGTWTVTVPGVSTRHLDVRFENDGDWAPSADPTFYGWTEYGVRGVAEEPMWRGDPIVRNFDKSTPVPFFGGTAPGAPIIRISRGATLSSASINNPGDEPGWVVWELFGPFTSAEVSVDGKVIEVPFSMAEGESLTIDARPSVRSAIDHTGADRYEELGEIAWAQVPEGGVVPLGITMAGAGAGRARVTLTPLYLRPWGTR